LDGVLVECSTAADKVEMMLIAGARLRTNAVRPRTMLAQQSVVFLFCAILVQT